MNEERYDGTDKQTDGVTQEQIMAAVRDAAVKRVTVYKPGRHCATEDGHVPHRA